MKITITHRNNKNQLLVSTKSLERFLERIVNDDAKNTVANFREYVPWLTNGYDGYKNMATWMHVHPAAEFQKSENGLLKMKQNNGVLLLTFVNIKDDGGRGCHQAKSGQSAFHPRSLYGSRRHQSKCLGEICFG